MVRCNQCGKELRSKNDIVKEGCVHADISWGYFSRKDGQKHRFNLCEDCYDKMISQFAIPITVEDNHELL